jgi:ABC-type transporter Mla subunit MlaD
MVVGVLLLATVSVNRGGTPRHSVAVVVSDASDLLAGDPITAAGQRVGTVRSMTPVRRGRAVRLVLDLDNQGWPLPRGSKFALHWGGTASFFNRYVELTRGPADASAMRDGAVLPSADFAGTVELDTVTGIFTPAVRRETARLIDRGGIAFDAARSPLRTALQAAPPALNQASKVLDDLQSSNTDLDTLLRSTDQVVNAVQTADPGIGQLLDGAGTTLAAIAAKNRALSTAVGKMPQALGQARTTLSHANGTLNAAGLLLHRLAPGVTDVRRIAAPLKEVLSAVTDVGPNVTATLATVRRSTPELNPLLTLATSLMPEIGSIGKQATEALQCVRPYSPDIAGFANNWGDFLSWGDGKDRVIRATLQNLLPAPVNGLPYNSATAAKLFPGLRYAFPRPPGDAAGQPWLLSQCGITRDVYDPAKDAEARTAR